MADPRSSAEPPLDADDPRISEWLDGRLAPAEAAEIERAVHAAPALVALVDDLRTIRGAMKAVAATAPPAGFGDRVMAAVTRAQDQSRSVVTPSGSRDAGLGRSRRLPWLGLAGALAAGLLVTVVINRPKHVDRDDGRREVALAPPAKQEVETLVRSDATLERASAARGRRRDAETNAAAATADEQATLLSERLLDKTAEEAGRGEFDDALRRSETKNSPPADEDSKGPLAKGDASGLASSREKESLDKASEQMLNGVVSGGGKVSDGFYGGGGAGGYAAAPLSDLAAGNVVAESGTPSPSAPAPAALVAPKTVLPPGSEGTPQFSGVPSEPIGKQGDEPAVPGTSPSARPASPVTRDSAKRLQPPPAAVLVIAVDSPSERKALDHLIAASGLEVTPANNRLELAGTPAAIDRFLEELEDAGLVTANRPARDAKKTKESKATSLVLRIVERKAKSPAAAGETKP